MTAKKTAVGKRVILQVILNNKELQWTVNKTVKYLATFQRSKHTEGAVHVQVHSAKD